MDGAGQPYTSRRYEPAEMERVDDRRGTRPSSSAMPVLVWFGDRPPAPPPWLVKDLLPQREVAIIAGQWAAGKTFIGVDLAACVMLGVPFAGREVIRHGAVLWLAAEGQSEIDVRVHAAVVERNGGREPDGVPFARQAFDVPRLTAPDAEERLMALADTFTAGLAQRWPGRELALIVIDTLGSTAGWVDANSSSEAQAVMDMLRRVNARTGALMLVIDHYGKAVETGVMGASAKAQSADAILAALSDRDMAGKHSNRRMAVTKLRGGPSGAETAFMLRPVPVGDGDATTCVVDWSARPVDGIVAEAKVKSPWSAGGRLFRSCMGRVLIDHGQLKRPFGVEGPEVKAAPVEKVRAEFIASYAGDSHDAKKKQWARMLKETTARDLVATRALGDEPVDWMWFTTKGEAE